MYGAFSSACGPETVGRQLATLESLMSCLTAAWFPVNDGPTMRETFSLSMSSRVADTEMAGFS